MPEMGKKDLSGVAETLFLTLYLRAAESQRPDALLRDESALKLVREIEARGLFDFSRIRRLPLSEDNKLVLILRSLQFDRYVRDFLARSPGAAVVQIGCGFDVRFERVDDGRVEWYDLDLPPVIGLRRQWIGREHGRYHLLSGSMLDPAWPAAVRQAGRVPCLFIAEGVFMYFPEEQIRNLVLDLAERFPGAELIFDAYAPLHAFRHNLRMASAEMQLRIRWAFRRGQELEKWGGGIHLIDEWDYFDSPAARLDHLRWLRPLEKLARTFRIYRFRLGPGRE